MPANLRVAEQDKSQGRRDKACQPLVPGHLGREATAIVETIHHFFLKAIEAELFELLQITMPASLKDTKQAPFSRVFEELGTDDHVIGLDLAPAPGCGFLTFPTQLLFRVLDILLAMPEGAGAEMGADESLRRVTGIELFILREFFEVFTRSLRDAWAPVYPVAFSQIATEEELKSRAATYGDDLALVLRATVELSGLEADVRLVIPAFLARMVQMKSASAVTSSSGAEPVHTNILNSLGAAILQMEAVLGGASIRFRNLLDLAPGQILVPGNKGTASIDCLVNEKPRFTGMLVASNGMCAIQIDTLTGTKLSDAAGNPFTGEAATPDK